MMEDIFLFLLYFFLILMCIIYGTAELTGQIKTKKLCSNKQAHNSKTT